MLRKPESSVERSLELLAMAQKLMPGGVGSNERAYARPFPISVRNGKGPRFWDVDGNEYIDYLLAFGPLILGHAHPAITQAVTRQLANGSVFGACHPLEVKVTQRLIEILPSMEQVRFSQSGTEAVLAAMRFARAATSRRLIIKFEGQYHGWADQVAISHMPGSAEAGPRSRPNVVPFAEGQAPGTYQDVLVLPWNDLGVVHDAFSERGREIAGVLTEPISYNCTVIEPVPGYMEGLRSLCDQYGAVLIFDEVQTGFRAALGGAQSLLGVSPDLTCLGKALSGGFAVSAVGGKASIMELAADRRVFHGGTYNSNPIGLAAIDAVLDVLSEPGVYEEMARLSHRLRDGLAEIIAPLGGYVQGSTTVFSFAFGPGPIRSLREGWRNDTEALMNYKKELVERGIYTKQMNRDIWNLSTEHTDQEIDETLDRAQEAADSLSVQL